MTDIPTTDVRGLDQQASAAAERVIAEVTVADLDRPTPCAAWNLGELLRHMVSENRGFAANAAGTPTDRSVFAPDFERLLGLLGRSPLWVPPC